jgi:hypothetical protein
MVAYVTQESRIGIDELVAVIILIDSEKRDAARQ